jgi:hypothetical protein
MKLGQVRWHGRLTAAIFEVGGARMIPEYSLYDLICRADKEHAPLAALAKGLASAHREDLPPVIPLLPREVWACGCTYEMSAAFRDAEHGTREGFYAHVHTADRPEIFFKGNARVCVGPGQAIGIRSDSKFTAPEPELAVVLGHHGTVLGYTLANDVSAWDIERENPLYLPQSKVYRSANCRILQLSSADGKAAHRISKAVKIPHFKASPMDTAPGSAYSRSTLAWSNVRRAATDNNNRVQRCLWRLLTQPFEGSAEEAG